MTPGYIDLEAESLQQYLAQFPTRAYEHAYDQGWTDGLPIIPANPESIERFVAASGRAADELIGILPPRKGRVTVEVIAANAIMAGCRPEYMPVIIAAIEAIVDPGFLLEHLQVTTGAPTPFLLVNGPARDKFEINFGTGCLGPGWRANSTIGRAVRLILYNGGGALPGVYSKSCTGSPLRSYICGENEEANPWTPFHVEHGFSREQSTVTVFYATSYCFIAARWGVDADEALRYIATNMPPQGNDGALLVLGVNTARMLHDAGFAKRDIQPETMGISTPARILFPKDFVDTQRAAGRGDTETMWRCASPEKFYVAVAGGPGPYDVYISAKGPFKTRIILEM